MATIALKGSSISTNGNLPKIGDTLIDFSLIKNDLSIANLNTFKGKNIILNIFPSIDTGTCATSVRNFNKEASALENTMVLCISRDLPFAQTRFCAAEGIDNVLTLSDFKSGTFGKEYGLEMIDGPLAGLHSRVVIVADSSGKITHVEQVEDIVNEPNYSNALKAI